MPKKLGSFLAAATVARKVPVESPPPPKLATEKALFILAPSSTSSSPENDATARPKKISLAVSPSVLSRLKRASSKQAVSDSKRSADDLAVEVSTMLTSILRGNRETPELPSPKPSDRMVIKDILDNPWFTNMTKTSTAEWRARQSRESKQKYIFKKVESRRFTKLMKMCANKLGTDSTIELFDKLGRETGVKDYNALIKLCIDKARCSSDKEASLVELHKAYQLFLSMREKGHEIGEESYGPFLQYMIDMKMTEEFQLFIEFFKNENSEPCSKIGYYEMLLWLTVGDEDKIHELCNYVGAARGKDGQNLAGNYVDVAWDKDRQNLAESYLLAFCRSNKKDGLLQLLEVLDIRNISSLNKIATIFKSFGRLQMESFAVKYLLELKTSGRDDEQLSCLIYDYVTSIPNLVVKEVVSNFSNLHKKLLLLPAVSSCNRLVALCCNIWNVHAALDVVNYMHESHLSIAVETFELILHACEQSYELVMVYLIYSKMQQLNVKPKGELLKTMIGLYVKLKDFEGAYNLLTDFKEMNEAPTTSMYNTIMAGYLRAKNSYGALMVLKQMDDADIKPDAETFSFLINNCKSEEEIVKYRDQMHHAGVHVTKHVYMALINAYANFQNFVMAKQIVVDCDISPLFLNEVKSVLVSALASNGQTSDALSVYDKIKQSKGKIEPKAVISLIEHIRTDGELNRLLQLLDELNNTSWWFDGCSRVILYCVHHNIANTAIELIKQLKEKDMCSTTIVIDQIFSQIWETKPTNLSIGLNILRAVKELGFLPSRTSLDFLLSTCVKARDLKSAGLVWSEYKEANLPYNVLTSLRMYQALVASGDYNDAKKMLRSIPKEDPHVRAIIESCKRTSVRRSPSSSSSSSSSSEQRE